MSRLFAFLFVYFLISGCLSGQNKHDLNNDGAFNTQDLLIHLTVTNHDSLFSAEAERSIFQAEHYFAIDSLDLAQYGDGFSYGLEDIIEDYSGTDAASRAAYQIGVLNRTAGLFEDAIIAFSKVVLKDDVFAPMALAGMGDCYSNLEDYAHAEEYFAKAADAAEDGLAAKVLAPSYHYKQAITLIELGRTEDAKNILSHIVSEHPNSRLYNTAVALRASLGRQINIENAERKPKEKFNNDRSCQNLCVGCVGCVNGIVITEQEYQIAVNIRRSLGFSGGQLPEEVWQDMTSSIYMSDEYSDIGLTVTNEEFTEILFGDLVSPYVSRAFYSNGDNKRTWVQNFQSMLTNPQGKANFMNYKAVIVAKRKKEKFEALAQAGSYTNALEGKYDYLNTERKAEFKYVVKLFNTIADSTVSLSERDVQVYYSEHKEDKQFEQIEGRDITMVKIPLGASGSDVSTINEELEGLASQWKNSNNAFEFAKINSGNDNPNRTLRLKDVETDITESTFFDIEVGSIVGPYQKEDVLIVANIISRSMVPDTAARVRHILLQAKDVKDADEMVALNSKADSLERLLKNGADFTDLASRFSDDPGSKFNGGVYDFFPQGRMVQPFNDFSFNKPIGSIGSVETSYGVHVIEVLDRRKKVEEVEVAMITRSLDASNKTTRDAYSASFELSIEATDLISLENSAEEAGYTINEAAFIIRKATSISGMKDARELVNWAYNAELGEISQPILVDNNYVVAILTASREKGTPKLEDVEEKMRAGALKEAKGEYYAMLMTGANIEEVATAVGVTVKTALNVNLKTSTIAGSGAAAEPEVAGLAFSIPVGEMSNPIIGNNGVWVIAPSIITEAAEKTDFLSEQSALVTTARKGLSLAIINSIRDGSDMIDNRN